MHFYGSGQALWSDVYIYLPSTSKIWKCGSFCIFACLLTLQAWNWKETTTAGLSSCSSLSPFVKLPLEPLSSLCVAALIHRADRSSGKQWASPLLTLRCWHFKWKKTSWMVTRQGHATSAASVDGRSLLKATPLEGRSWRAAALRTPKLMDLLDGRNLCKSSKSEWVATSSSHRITRHKTQLFHNLGIADVLNAASVLVRVVCPSSLPHTPPKNK